MIGHQVFVFTELNLVINVIINTSEYVTENRSCTVPNVAEENKEQDK
jgi:hypothetical protein